MDAAGHLHHVHHLLPPSKQLLHILHKSLHHITACDVSLRPLQLQTDQGNRYTAERLREHKQASWKRSQQQCMHGDTAPVAQQVFVLRSPALLARGCTSGCCPSYWLPALLAELAAASAAAASAAAAAATHALPKAQPSGPGWMENPCVKKSKTNWCLQYNPPTHV